MTEIFKAIKGYEGIYQVSNFGRVKSLEREVKRVKGIKTLKERILKTSVDNRGYFNVGLYKNREKKTRTVHQLVCESFLNHTPCGYKLIINHIDFNPLNNNVDNLEIISQRENTNRKHIKSSSIYTGVSWHKGSKKWQAYIAINGKLKYLGYFHCEIKASEAYQKELKIINNNN